MDIKNILIAALSLTTMGAIFALILGIAAKVFHVPVDERIPLVQDALPGANCGGCGFAGCSAFATAVVEGKAKTNGCPVGGNAVGIKVAEIMGVAAANDVKQVAVVRCNGTTENATLRFEYNGIADCKALIQLGGSAKDCLFACCGLGNCERACKFDAIHVVNGAAVVDREKCTACGACVKACPKVIINLMPYDSKVSVQCSSIEKGAAVRAACKVGCIGCGICAKNCPSQAITMENNLARIDYTKCTGCGVCVEKCPRKIIHTL